MCQPKFRKLAAFVICFDGVVGAKKAESREVFAETIVRRDESRRCTITLVE